MIWVENKYIKCQLCTVWSVYFGNNRPLEQYLLFLWYNCHLNGLLVQRDIFRLLGFQNNGMVRVLTAESDVLSSRLLYCRGLPYNSVLNY